MMNPLSASAEAFFRSVRAFANDLEAEGHTEAAAAIKAGLSRVNGLTDGWSQFGEALDGVRARHGSHLTEEQQAKLDALAAAVWDVVHRQ
jgi:hypothetical protein